MAKGYHNLSGLVRDLRNADRDAAEGSETASQLLDDLADLLELLLEGGSIDDAGGENDDGDGGDEPAETASAPVPRGTETGSAGVGTHRERPTQHSLRARQRAESGRRSRTDVVAVECGVPRRPAATAARSRDGGKR